MEPHYRTVSETDLTQEKFNQILCPNLRVGIRMGLLNPDAEGWVTLDELHAFLTYIGLGRKSLVQNLLVKTGKMAQPEPRKGYLNLTVFRGTFLDHGSESCVLNNTEGFLQERLDILLSFVGENGKAYKQELGIALNNFHQCPFKYKSFKGTNITAFEFGGLLEVYGRQDDDGKQYFTRQDIIDLWQHSRFPTDWQVPNTTSVSSFRAFLTYFQLMFGRVFAGWKHVGEGGCPGK